MPTAPLFSRVDHLVVAVRDLDGAERTYSALLGRAPSWHGHHVTLGTRNVLYVLGDCAVELLALAPGATPSHAVAAALARYLERRPEGLFAVALGTADAAHATEALRAVGIPIGPVAEITAVATSGAARRARVLVLPRECTRGVNLFAVEHDPSAVPPAPLLAPAATAVGGVDHVVMFSDDLPGALRLWRDTLGIPQRWQRELPQRGTVNVGLRLGGVTLELVAPLGHAAGDRGERLWGIAYTVQDCDGAVARLRAADIAVSDAREGLAPATCVATVRWADRVPTLLLQHLDRR